MSPAALRALRAAERYAAVPEVSRIGVALYGVGNVGGGLAEVIVARRAELAESGLALNLCAAVVRHLERPRPLAVDRSLLTTDLRAPRSDARVDVVVEAMGGLEPAGRVIRKALLAGKSVVTANKALIAARGEELETLAANAGALLRYEGAVCGAIPVLGALRTALVGNRIRRIRGIVNGTTNYILTRMVEAGLPFAEALSEAQAQGFAEVDPSADVSGLDAAQKLVILARHAFGAWRPVSRVAREGIELVSLEDLESAKRRGRTIKLVAEAVREPSGEIRLSVGPAALSGEDPLAGVRNELNAVVVEGDFSGPLFFQGPGAGGRATASAVYGDLVEVARATARGVAVA